MPAEILALWEQRENESPEAFEAFDKYRTLGPARSLAKVAELLGKSVQLMEKWASPTRHEWRRRALAFDRHEARTINDQVLAGTAQMRQRLAQQGMNMQLRAAQHVQNMTQAQLSALSPQQIVAFFRAGADIEMKARAIPESEMDQAERDDAPKFEIKFLSGKPEGMVSVRLLNGDAGYIPLERVDEFLAENEGATAIR